MLDWEATFPTVFRNEWQCGKRLSVEATTVWTLSAFLPGIPSLDVLAAGCVAHSSELQRVVTWRRWKVVWRSKSLKVSRSQRSAFTCASSPSELLHSMVTRTSWKLTSSNGRRELKIMIEWSSTGYEEIWWPCVPKQQFWNDSQPSSGKKWKLGSRTVRSLQLHSCTLWIVLHDRFPQEGQPGGTWEPWELWWPDKLGSGSQRCWRVQSSSAVFRTWRLFSIKWIQTEAERFSQITHGSCVQFLNRGVLRFFAVFLSDTRTCSSTMPNLTLWCSSTSIVGRLELACWWKPAQNAKAVCQQNTPEFWHPPWNKVVG